MKPISLATIIAILFCAITTQAQDNRSVGKTSFSIETDPSTFVFKGYAFHIRIKPKNSRHLVIGAGTYALDLPDVMVDINKDNKSKGWNVRINSAYSLFGEQYFGKANEKWFVGLQTGIQTYRIINDNIVGKQSKYSNLLLMPSVGYNWHPFKFPLYIKPWAGVGYISKISGSNSIDNFLYNISPFTPFLTLHIGYTFGKQYKVS
ncbi:MAG: hypothetical protein K2Q21_13235 [Chitinophagaceae bacterium]|nr:hypothetical protein [Chitinophagaceae bacterium]